MPHKKSNPNEWISLVNVVSCVAVIILHTNGCFWNFSKERYWVTADIIEIADPVLKKEIQKELGITGREITEDDVEKLTELRCSDQ